MKHVKAELFNRCLELNCRSVTEVQDPFLNVWVAFIVAPDKT